MKKITILLFFSMLIGSQAWASIPKGYYSNAVGKQDEALMTALEGIINVHSLLTYNELWDAYPSTDAGDDGYYIDMYSTCKYNHGSYHVGTASYVGQGLNREHSFPKSWFGGEVYPMYTDLTMIIPTDGYVNQRRSNHPYGVCEGGITYTNEELNVSMKGKIGNSTYDGYSQTVFEPDDEYKGDFARIYFYMVTCYKSQVGSWPGSGQLDSSNDYKAFSDWSLQLLMEWHRADPVSAKEISRNEAVYVKQGNRNPFVDHPELAEYIWGTKQHSAWSGDNIPDDPITKVQPVMMAVDTTAVTGSSFRADWTSGGDVSSYTLKVNRIASATEAPTPLLTEGFSQVQANSDGRTDIGTTLNSYTDNPGWTGYKVYVGAGNGIKVGTGDVVGYLNSPELELAGTITVVVNAKSWINGKGVSDGSSMVVSCGDVSQTVELSTNPTDYTIVLNGCRENTVKFTMTEPAKRFYVYHVDIYNGDITAAMRLRQVKEQGDSTMRTVSGITDTCYTVKALTDGIFEYYVKAIYTDGTDSPWSNVQHVTITGGDIEPLIGDINGDGEVNISDVMLLINYILGNQFDAMDMQKADLNNDREVNISDVMELINLITKMQ